MSNDNIVKAYKQVIADFASDIGYREGVQEQVLGVLKGRLDELVNVWGYKDEEAN
jgi:hypothetical protein